MMETERRIAAACLLLGVVCLGAVAGLVAPRLRGVAHRQSDRQAHTIRVLSWNIGHVYLGDYRDSRAADEDLPHVASVIAQAAADIVTLQELRDRRQLDALLARLDGIYVAGMPASDEERNDRYAAVLVNRSFSPHFSTVVTSSGRALPVAMFELQDTPWAVASVHLDAFDPRTRLTQVEEMLDWTARAELDQLIVAGDFNFDADLVVRHDPKHVDAALYRFLTSRFEDAARFGLRTTIVDRRIDYVFFRGPILRKRTTVIERAGTRLMDHVPLVVELTLSPGL